MKHLILYLLFNIFISYPTQAQTKLSGNIVLNDKWERMLYVLRVDGFAMSVPQLIDSIVIQANGDFKHTLRDAPKGTVYLLKLPPKEGNYRTVIEGKNYFFITNADSAIIINANADELFSSMQFTNSPANSEMLYYRDMQSPIYSLFKHFETDVKNNPNAADSIKEVYQQKIMKETAIFKNKVLSKIETTDKDYMLIAGLYNLHIANFGKMDKEYGLKTLERIDNQNIKFVSNVQEALKSIEFSRVGSIVPNVAIHEGDSLISTQLYDIIKPYTVLYFWASWCMPCRASNKESIKRLINTLDKDVAFISISVDENVDNWRKASKQDNITWPNYIDKTTIGLNTILQIGAVPKYLVINSDKKVLFETSAAIELKNYLQQIEQE